MNKKEFVGFCKKKFSKYGFEKKGKYFYRQGKNLICGLYLQHSSFGKYYYINFFYSIGNYIEILQLPTIYDSHIDGRILIMSKTQTFQGERFLTAQIEYEEYSEEELRSFIDGEFQKIILPPIIQGKKYILDNLNSRYTITLNREEVLNWLAED